MIYLCLLGGIFLGWSFGRNNLASVFGTAIGTRMVPFKLATVVMGFFILLGVFFSSSYTLETMRDISDVNTGIGALLISGIIALTFLLATKAGLPTSVAQGSVGALVGWNLFFHEPNNWSLLVKMVSAWFYGPALAAFLTILGFYAARLFLKHVPIPLLYRDFWIRILLILGGAYTSYFLGANNIPAIIGPYLNVTGIDLFWTVYLVTIAVVIGVFMADKRVISTVSSGLYPLSPMEALVVVMSCGLSMSCFSSVNLANFLTSLHLPTFPLVPVPTASILVGSIMGIGLAKGHASIKWSAFMKIVASWVVIPIISGLICYTILTILNCGGIDW